MKLSKLAITFAMAGGLSAATAFGETGLQHPASVQQTGFETGSYDYYAADEKPKEGDKAPDAAPPAAASAAPAASCDSCNKDASCGCESKSCGCSNGCEECKMDCPEQEVCRCFDCCCLKCHDATLQGWIEGGIMFNDHNPQDRWNGPDGFNDRSSEAQLNQLYLFLERIAKTDGCGFNWGGRVDLLYGTDAKWTTARGLDAHENFAPRWNSDNDNFYALAMPQLYAEFAYNNLSVKVGHYYAPVGYEVVPAIGNFFYSHAYTMMYGEPFTFTGFLATWKPNEQFNVFAGMTNGWNNWDNEVGHQSLITGVIFNSCDKNTTLGISLSTGEDSFTPGTVNPGQRTLVSTVFTRNITDRLTYVFQNDDGWQQNFDGNGNQAEWYGINQYLFYKINCCWTCGLRAEWFRDDDGYVVAAPGDFQGGNPASEGGFAGNFYEITAGLNWKPNANFWFRPEIRYDWYSGPANANGTLPYDDGNKEHQMLAGFDLIYQY